MSHSFSNLFNTFFNSNSVLCSADDLPFLSSIYNVASVELSNYRNDGNYVELENETGFKEKVDLTKKNFEEILQHFNEAIKARDEFVHQAPIWLPLRRDVVQKLRNIADKINQDRFNCNVSKITGSAVSTVGFVAATSALVFPPAAIIGVPALVVSALGGATVFGTQVTEMALLKKSLKEAQEAKTKDEKAFESMRLWFKHSQAIIELTEGIMGFSLATQIRNELKNFTDDIIENIKKNVIPSKFKTIISLATKLLVRAGAPTGFLSLIPIVTTFFFSIVLLRKNCCFVFDCIIISHRVAFGLMKALDLGGDIGLVIANAVAKAGAIAEVGTVAKIGATTASRTTARVVAHGVFAGIGVALDVTNIVFSSIDIHKGSISEYSVKLKELAYALEEEQKSLQSIFRALVPK